MSRKPIVVGTVVLLAFHPERFSKSTIFKIPECREEISLTKESKTRKMKLSIRSRLQNLPD